MLLSDCFQLGVITKTHGTKGELQVTIDSDTPESYKNVESVLLLINKELVPFFLEQWQLSGSRAIAKFEEIDSPEKAAGLVHLEVYLPDSMLPGLGEGKYYFHDLVGMDAFDGDTSVGTITNVYNLPGHDLLAIDHQGKEVLVPMTDAIISAVDTRSRKVLLNLPEGLLDLYLE